MESNHRNGPALVLKSYNCYTYDHRYQMHASLFQIIRNISTCVYITHELYLVYFCHV